MQRLFRRGRVWYGWFYENGRRVTRTTQCRDRAAAERVARQWERDAADPDHAAARTATLTDALQLLLRLDEEEVAAGRRSPDTVDFHRTKAGPPGPRVRDERARRARPVPARAAPRLRRGRLHLAPPRRGRRGHDHLEGAGGPPQVAPPRHPRRPLARARRRGHPDRVLAGVRAAEARAHRGRARRSSSPSSSRTAPRASRSSSRRPPAGARPSSPGATTWARGSRRCSCGEPSGRPASARSRS